MLKKFGTETKIHVVKGSFEVDPSLLATKIQEAFPKGPVSLDQLHEFVKSKGVTNYSSEDMSGLIGQLKSMGIEVTH